LIAKRLAETISKKKGIKLEWFAKDVATRSISG
jgi:hypothetical protein